MFTGFESPTHLLLLFLVILLLFGAKRLPEIGRGLGSGIHGFKEALTNPDKTEPEALTSPDKAIVASTGSDHSGDETARTREAA
jgi:sec-independent protein translocase protein TatA